MSPDSPDSNKIVPVSSDSPVQNSIAPEAQQQISKEKEEELTKNYIALLLAQEADDMADQYFEASYYDQYRQSGHYNEIRRAGNDSDSDGEANKKAADDDYQPNWNEDDYLPEKRPASKKRRQSEANKSESTPKDSAQLDTDVPEEKPEKKKRQKHPVLPGMNTGSYTEEEEARFLEGLELFGRDWKKLMAHIATRDSNSIRSHAQKHFIKLFRDNKPLPDKVKETGAGYTLSGEPLDPNSAAAKNYLKNWVPPTGTTDDNGGTNPTNPPTQQDGSNTTTETEKQKATESKRKAPQRADEKVSKKQVREVESASPEITRKQMPVDRPRRAAAQNVKYFGAPETMNELSLLPCEAFGGKQPFKVFVTPYAIALMDLHSHLSKTEIIGFLGGEWIPSEKRINIKSAFPCRNLDHKESNTEHSRDVHVELDPASAVEVQAEISRLGMRVVGWYHSHPSFIPDPSVIDVENQRNYQKLFKWDKNGGNEKDSAEESDFSGVLLSGSAEVDFFEEEPFVGAIIGPFDRKLPTPISAINWFCVNDSSNAVGVHKPKRILYNVLGLEDVIKRGIPRSDYLRMISLIDTYSKKPDRTNFAEIWRADIPILKPQDATTTDDSNEKEPQKEFTVETMKQKLLKSLAFWLKDDPQIAAVRLEDDGSEKLQDETQQGSEKVVGGLVGHMDGEIVSIATVLEDIAGVIAD
ncbi:hypothetical protein HK098_002872 [Nowakowskiella sp. JEL0407]|nr:hypothetical protein HK098_002872 [Nowakowskiella sp. JEL0407]